ncbi:hypothetical protein COM13_04530 [Bacillus pseudomycoides]|uniref:hypothetical protein n=1 Tax=Bacillus pseudomycoides TaxID=64104 RepID=UPI000BEE02A6|nr:hypothetical protein [Bacillus pseudomycoides]PDY01281.1 hypothetical protein COO07_05515 [Bacillus pseudomycoides]PEK76721.1 hypothetical protein CN597_21705 [Bacillus pseudomycoides]PEN10635.1 hypothetical protein CN640_06495 [Bacillus pseudomycoides]PGB91616.1 hypothetical protein COM13_04530 [Bacillus pseudomycoides]PHE54986.1 hypothetical protein COF52_17315 [Bacillus pseudomycoides]
MNQTFPSKDNRTWLKEVHESRSQRSLLLGKEAIDLLVKQNLPVTLKTVSEKSKDIDPEGKGIHRNTISTNQELNAYYKQHSKSYKKKLNINKSTQKRSVAFTSVDYRRIRSDRSIENTERKYMKMSKKELVQRLILAEQYIAENNSKWVANYFEMFK